MLRSLRKISNANSREIDYKFIEMHSNLTFIYDQIRLLQRSRLQEEKENHLTLHLCIVSEQYKIHDHERGYAPRSFGGPLRIERKYIDGGKERGKERSVENNVEG